jgi:hypothetical protein
MTLGIVVSLASNEHVINSVVAALSTSIFTTFLRSIGLLRIKNKSHRVSLRVTRTDYKYYDRSYEILETGTRWFWLFPIEQDTQ